MKVVLAYRGGDLCGVFRTEAAAREKANSHQVLCEDDYVYLPEDVQGGADWPEEGTTPVWVALETGFFVDRTVGVFSTLEDAKAAADRTWEFKV